MAECRIKVLLPTGQPAKRSFVTLAYYGFGSGYSDEHPTDENGCATIKNPQPGLADVLVNGVILRRRVVIGDGAEYQVTLQ